MFSAPQEAQETTERARDEADGAAHWESESLFAEAFLAAALAERFSKRRWADASILLLMELDILERNPRALGSAIACSSTIVLIPVTCVMACGSGSSSGISSSERSVFRAPTVPKLSACDSSATLPVRG